MRIGEVARKAGVGVETLRFYERKGLIRQPAKPLDGGCRSYPSEAVDRVRFVCEAQRLGFSLEEIGELLALRADPRTDCADVRDRARAKLGEVDNKIARLVEIRTALTRLVGECGAQGPASDCPILQALDRDEKETTP